MEFDRGPFVGLYAAEWLHRAAEFNVPYELPLPQQRWLPT